MITLNNSDADYLCKEIRSLLKSTTEQLEVINILKELKTDNAEIDSSFETKAVTVEKDYEERIKIYTKMLELCMSGSKV